MINKNFWKGKKVFLTGHTGFKGSWLCLWLSELEAITYGYSLEPPTEPSLFNNAKIEELVQHHIGDIRDLEKLCGVMIQANPDIVIHMAAQPLVSESYQNPVETYQTNVMGTVNMLEAVRLCENVRAVVNVTTDKCYENREWVWGYREIDTIGGYDPYSNSKGCSELVTSAYRNSFFNKSLYGKSHQVALASARAGNVIGGGDWAKNRLVPDIMRSFQRGQKALIRNPGAIRPWQHVLESLSGYLVLVERLYGEDGIHYAEGWNFGPSGDDIQPVSLVVEKICMLWGNDVSYDVETSTRHHEAGNLKLDISKAKARLNWEPTWNLDEALSYVVRWYKVDIERQRSETKRQISKFIGTWS